MKKKMVKQKHIPATHEYRGKRYEILEVVPHKKAVEIEMEQGCPNFGALVCTTRVGHAVVVQLHCACAASDVINPFQTALTSLPNVQPVVMMKNEIKGAWQRDIKIRVAPRSAG